MKRGLPKYPLLFALAFLLALPPGAARAAEPFRQLAPGLWFGRLSAQETVRWGSPDLAVLRIDPARYRFKVLAAEPGQEGLTAGAWQKKTGAIAVFNAGQYAEDGSYLGLLIKNGKARGRLAGRLEALFLAGGADAGLPRARVVDLRYTAFDPGNSPYGEAAQSLMLLDRFGQIRVRRSPKIANRTLVAQDAAGRILVVVSLGGHTLWELASFLNTSGLDLREVMCMDGGTESQLTISLNGFSFSHYGSPTAGGELLLPWPTTTLPVALAVFGK